MTTTPGGLRLPDRARGSDLQARWSLDPEFAFLNHGSFGAAPVEVLEAQSKLRAQLEREPLRFFVDEYRPLLEAARRDLAAFLRADSSRLAWVPNATTGVNAVLQSFPFRQGDELLTTNHEYNACRNALNAIAEKHGCHVVVVELPYPIDSRETAIEIVSSAVTAKTRLALIDHITSPTALVLPLDRLVPLLEDRGVKVLVDGAHAPGMIPLKLDSLGASFYAGNCHKWLCSPKGAGFVYVRDPESGVRPVVISHGANEPPSEQSRFHQEFDWAGTADPTPWLSVPAALQTMEEMVPGGWEEVRTRNRELALRARDMLASRIGTTLPCPDSMIGSMAAIPLPDGQPNGRRSSWDEDPLQKRLFREWAIEVPIIAWPSSPHRLIRVSAQLYNRIEQYEYLAEALEALL